MNNRKTSAFFIAVAMFLGTMPLDTSFVSPMIVSAAEQSEESLSAVVAPDTKPQMATIYESLSKETSFQMNGRTFYQGITFHGGSTYNNTNTSEVTLNVENVKSFECTIGHIDNTTLDSAVLTVYKDNVKYEEVNLTFNMPLKTYQLDVSDAKNVRFVVVRNSDSAYGFGDIKIDGKEVGVECIIPTYQDDTDLIHNAFNGSSYQEYDGADSSEFFTINELNYDTGITFSGGSYDNKTGLVSLNVEKMNLLSFQIAHVDDTASKDCTMRVYVDNELTEMLKLSADMPLSDYTIDVSKANLLQFSIDCPPKTQCAFVNFTFSNEESDICDVNGNGTVSIADAVLASRIANEDSTAFVSRTQIKRSDTNGDGTISIVDIMTILRAISKSES